MYSNASKLMSIFGQSLWYLPDDQLQSLTDIMKESLPQLLHMKEGEQASYGTHISGSTAVLPITGVLVPEDSYFNQFMGLTSTFALHEEFLRLSNDPNIETIILYFRCAGGNSIGLLEFADAINNSGKTVHAFTDYFMTSAAYLLATPCNTISATPSSRIGSIGARLSVTKFASDDSQTKTYIFQRGDTKTYGDPNVPMTQAEFDYFDDAIERSYLEFVNAVHDYRGLSIEYINSLQARSDSAQYLQPLVDRIITKEDFFKEL